MSDRSGTIAAFIRTCRNANRRELVRAIILRWPDVSIDEFLRAAHLAAGQIGVRN
jgi:hypothetical protein